MNIFISGSDRGLGFAMTKQLLQLGHIVFAGQFLPDWQDLSNLKKEYNDRLHIVPLDIGSDESVEEAAKIVKNHTDKIDILISNAGITGWDDETMEDFTDTQMMQNVYNINAIGSVRLTEHFFALTHNSNEKKLCYISSEASSITDCKRKSFFWYSMSKIALNMYVQTMFNRKRNDGYKFRLYHPGWIKSYMGGDKINHAAKYTPDEAAKFAIDYFLNQNVDEDILVLKSYDDTTLPF